MTGWRKLIGGARENLQGLSFAPRAPIQNGLKLRLNSSWRTRVTSIAVACGLLMEFVDTTALATALPTMARSFGVRPEELKLALTTYVLALAVFMPASGWLADRFGAQRVYLSAMGTFCVGSLACALSTSLRALIVARAVQGLGGALMTPVARTIILRSARQTELVSAMNWFTMPAQLGPLLGPPLGGLVLAVADWRWIFLINLPIAGLGAVAIMRFVRNEAASHRGSFDFRGYVLVGTSITLFIVATEMVSTRADGAVLVATVVGAVATGALYVRHALRASHPVLDIRLFVDSTFRVSMAAGTLARLAVGASPLLLPLLLQVGLGWSPLLAGQVLMGQAVGTLLAKAASTRAIRRFSLREVLIASNLAAAVMNMVPALYGVSTPAWLIFLATLGMGLARSMQFTINNTVAYADLERAKLSGASTISSVVQQIGHALGISLGGLLLVLSREANHGALDVSAFAMPFVVVGAVAATASLVYGRLDADAGDAIRGRPRAAG
jgi:EmrB/QacA subfamily drug resistance transporter